jgi:hypothetical protein
MVSTLYRKRYNHELDKEFNSPNALNVTKTRRIQGRPKSRWADGVNSDSLALGVRYWTHCAQHRQGNAARHLKSFHLKSDPLKSIHLKLFHLKSLHLKEITLKAVPKILVPGTRYQSRWCLQVKGLVFGQINLKILFFRLANELKTEAKCMLAEIHQAKSGIGPPQKSEKFLTKDNRICLILENKNTYGKVELLTQIAENLCLK